MPSNVGMTKALFLALSFFITGVSFAQGAFCQDIEAAFAVGDRETLVSLDVSAAPEYWQAFRTYRLAALDIQRDNRKAARSHLKTGLRIIKKLHKKHPDDIEVVVLSGMLHGQRAIVGRGFGWISGWKSYRLLKRAQSIAPDNPRLLLATGVGQLLAPGLLRSKPETAKNTLTKALSNVGETPCRDQTWGEVDLAIWLGRAYLALENPIEANKSFARAEALSPGNVWVAAAAKGEGYVWVNDEVKPIGTL
ncbi:MAG: hypothetical protein AAF438_18590 [Pseudomonadota bacterium]